MASRRKGPQAAPAQHADEQPAALQTAPPACMMAPVGEPARCPEPLHVVAHIRDTIVTAPMLDALLAYHTAQRAGLPMWARPDEQPRVEIPIARSPCGRFHLASRPQFAVQESEQRFKSRRPIVEPAQLLAGPSVRRLDIQTGANKGFRIPYSTHLVAGGVVHWWCMGDRDRIAEMLRGCLHLGNNRRVGHGWVERWDVQQAEPWPGFPVVQDGRPLRALPLDWPGVTAGGVGMSALTYPYWAPERKQPCRVP